MRQSDWRFRRHGDEKLPALELQCPNIWLPSPQGLGALMEPLGTHYFCNVVHLQPLTGNRPLSATVIFLFHQANLIKVRCLELPESKDVLIMLFL